LSLTGNPSNASAFEAQQGIDETTRRVADNLEEGEKEKPVQTKKHRLLKGGK